MSQRLLLSMFVAAGILMTTPASLPAADAAETLAKKALEQFLKAYKASNVDEIMEAVDTPWFHDGKELIKDREQLKREFQKELGRDKDRAGLQHKIENVVAYKSVRDKLQEAERKLADEVVKEDDRVILVRIGKDVSGNQGDKVAFLVRIRDGKAKVVGLKD